MLKQLKLLFYFFPVFIAFILPFGNAISSPLIALWLITSFFNYKALFQKAQLKNKWYVIITLFFVLTVISNYLFFNSNDPINAIEIKLSFLLFPLLFFLYQINYATAKRIIAAFVSGCLFACLACVSRALIYLFQGDSSQLYYSNFSYFMHSSYFAMYLNLAIVFVAFFYFKWFKAHAFYNKLSIVMIVLFVVCIILCASKIGFITLFVLIPFILLLEYRSQIKRKHLIVAAATMVVVLVSSYFVFPQVFNRLKSVSVISSKTIDKSSTESSVVRILIWNECRQLIKENFISGVGVSFANERLYQAYEKDDLKGAYDKKLNAHNQYLQSFIGMGVLGFFNLLLITLGVVFEALRRKNNLLLFFGILVSVNFLVESMLQTSAGTVFYVFFLCFLLVFDKVKLKNETV